MFRPQRRYLMMQISVDKNVVRPIYSFSVDAIANVVQKQGVSGDKLRSFLCKIYNIGGTIYSHFLSSYFSLRSLCFYFKDSFDIVYGDIDNHIN